MKIKSCIYLTHSSVGDVQVSPHMGDWFNPFPNKSWFLCVSSNKSFKNTVAKRTNCLQRAISPFPTVFSTLLENFLPLSSNLKLSSANSFRLEESKISRLGKG